MDSDPNPVSSSATLYEFAARMSTGIIVITVAIVSITAMIRIHALLFLVFFICNNLLPLYMIVPLAPLRLS